jgi:dTDP-4-amino-4,6-dideoxy-D-galactose acyltransferase
MTDISAFHKDRALAYASLSFLRIDNEKLIDNFCTHTIGKDTDIQVIGSQTRCFYRHLGWDSDYLDYPSYRIEFCLWDESIVKPIEAVKETLLALKEQLSSLHAQFYLFTAEIPSEDLVTIQALGEAGLNLIETRLAYYHDDIAKFSPLTRYNTRLATNDDIPNLHRVAMEARNSFDRLHADPYFSNEIADAYLGTFIENSVKGFTDIVLVPDDENLPGAFFAADLISAQQSPLNIPTGEIVLTAAGESRRGWHFKLMSEISLYFQKHGLQMAYMKTQSTNRAVIRNCEKLGWKYGKCAHIFAAHG